MDFELKADACAQDPCATAAGLPGEHQSTPSGTPQSGIMPLRNHLNFNLSIRKKWFSWLMTIFLS